MIKTNKKLKLDKNGEDIISILNHALQVVEPQQLVNNYLKKNKFWKKYQNIHILGFGKASYPMALAAENILKGKIKSGAIITPITPLKPKLKKIKILPGSHPLPNSVGIKSTRQLISLANKISAEDLVICLISGGGSSLLTLPAVGITLADLQKISALLIKQTPADIREINIVRKHLSQIKGGQLAKLLWPADVHTLIISDVAKNKHTIIASGPTAPDNSTFGDAWRIIEKYKLTKKITVAIKYHLRQGLNKKITETPNAKCKIFKKVTNQIIGDNELALQAASRQAKKLGYKTIILPDFLQDEVGKAAREFATLLDIIKSGTCLIAGGETTVRVRGKGQGGRNQEFALHTLKHIPKKLLDQITLATMATDGVDGFCPEPIAGALINSQTAELIKKSGLKTAEFIKNNDSYNFFKKINSQLITGPTNTNVRDIVVAIKESSS